MSRYKSAELNCKTDLQVQNLTAEFTESKMSLEKCIARLQQIEADSKNSFAAIPNNYWEYKFNKIGAEKYQSQLDDFKSHAIKLGMNLWENNKSKIKRDYLLELVNSKNKEELNKKVCNM